MGKGGQLRLILGVAQLPPHIQGDPQGYQFSGTTSGNPAAK